jgi:prepilin-type N-terminal cleavage/methylation domain-containing protein
MSHSKGFSLVELAVALAIIALLLAGALIPLSAQIDVRNVADTRRSMDSIREAIIGFAQANGRLPCPAAGNLAAGTEQFTAPSCTALIGVVPWATLGVSETDAWGRRFSYRVSPAFADSIFRPSPPNPPGTPLTTWNTLQSSPPGLGYTPPAPPPTFLPQSISSPPSPADQAPLCNLTTAPTLSSFALCTLGDIAVFTRVAPGPPAASGVALPAVIISHGKNGFGAWQANGTPLNPIPTGSDELANLNGNTQLTPAGGYASWAFFSRPPTPAASPCSDAAGPSFCEFDDIVVMISSSALIARMVAAGRLP